MSTDYAETLLAEHLARNGASAQSIEALCAEHPPHAGELRELFSAYLAAQGAVDGSKTLPLPPLFRQGHAQIPRALQEDLHVEPGQEVGDFRLEALLGRGGMGQVWKARQLSLDREVAFKLMLRKSVDDEALERFVREARAGARLSHPGIVAVHDRGTSGGLAWISMELVAGGATLCDFIEEAVRAASLEPDYYSRVCAFVARVAGALQVAHAAGIIHRDIKPSNILITDAGLPKVTDFGLARIVDESALTRTGHVAGTYCYMSPEQAMGRVAETDPRTDVFSLGAVLYEMLALRRPFDGDTAAQIVSQIVADDPIDPRTIRSRVPRDLAVIAAKCLEKNPGKRYQTMGELEADLLRHASHQPILATAPTVGERLVKWVRRHPTGSAATAIAGVAFVAITALLIANWRTARSEAARAEEVLGLSAFQRLEELTQDAAALWPAVPSNISKFRAWIALAQELNARQNGFRSQMERLQASASSGVRAASAATGELVFDDEREKWWHGQLQMLTTDLEVFADLEAGLAGSGISPEHGWSVQRRLDEALTLEEMLKSQEWLDAWEEASAAIRDDLGLDVPPQVALWPLGVDRASGLWEFWHTQSGERPVRVADGSLEFTGQAGIVLVLVSGGTFWMGAQPDPDQPNYDRSARAEEQPVHEVTLAPYFIAKHEMTQAQWELCTGHNPSFFEASGPRAPVENIDWYDSRRVLGSLGLRLPTEAEWEYACRAGTETPWWTGEDKSTLADARATNLQDKTFDEARSMPSRQASDLPEYEDGFVGTAPVASFRGNAFGLFDVYGNVLEWCEDEWDRKFYSRSPEVDPVCRQSSSADSRVIRGGSYDTGTAFVRSAARQLNPAPNTSSGALGVRPARTVHGLE